MKTPCKRHVGEAALGGVPNWVAFVYRSFGMHRTKPVWKTDWKRQRHAERAQRGEVFGRLVKVNVFFFPEYVSSCLS